MSEPFEVGGFTYRAGKLDARTQFHVVRRLAPVLGSFRDILAVVRPAEGQERVDPIEAIEPLADAVSKMPDDHVDYVLDACLSVCQREQPGGAGWSPVWNVQAKRPQFEDIDMLAMLQIVANVLAGALSGFFPGLLFASSGAAEA
jgi:hypothetical protein